MLNILLTVQLFGVCRPPAPLVVCAAAALAGLGPAGNGEVVAAVAEVLDDETFDVDDFGLDEDVCCIVVGSVVS